jgi:hypothetical protein
VRTSVYRSPSVSGIKTWNKLAPWASSIPNWMSWQLELRFDEIWIAAIGAVDRLPKVPKQSGEKSIEEQSDTYEPPKRATE